MKKCSDMSISPVKRLILETMWMLGKPARAAEIAKEAGLAFPSTMMHVIGLSRMGYVSMPEKGLYAIAKNGKKALELPEVTKEKAVEILAYQPVERSFHFYADIGKPLNIHAASLGDFCDKIAKVDSAAVDFHISRGDFEAWFNGLGDAELARKILLVREEKLPSDAFQRKLVEVVKNRCSELTRIRNGH